MLKANKIIRFVKVIILLVACFSLGMIVKDYIKSFYDDYMNEYKGTYSYDGEDVVVVIPEAHQPRRLRQY